MLYFIDYRRLKLLYYSNINYCTIVELIVQLLDYCTTIGFGSLEILNLHVLSEIERFERNLIISSICFF